MAPHVDPQEGQEVLVAALADVDVARFTTWTIHIRPVHRDLVWPIDGVLYEVDFKLPRGIV
jgi:hypothetical protein